MHAQNFTNEPFQTLAGDTTIDIIKKAPKDLSDHRCPSDTKTFTRSRECQQGPINPPRAQEWKGMAFNIGQIARSTYTSPVLPQQPLLPQATRTGTQHNRTNAQPSPKPLIIWIRPNVGNGQYLVRFDQWPMVSCGQLESRSLHSVYCLHSR